LTFRAVRADNPRVVHSATRDALLLDVLRASGRASVADLAAQMHVGEATVRRSLQRLAGSGEVIRTYGGAALADAPRAGATRSRDPELGHKRAIGAAAAELVRDGDTIALSSGSTVLELARRLRDRRLTVITNALDVAGVLLDAEGIDLVVLGGVVIPRIHSLRGHLTEVGMGELRADTAFMGVSAIDLEHGFMTDHVAEIAVDRALRGMARDAVVLADASKFDRVAPGFMFGFEQVGTLVTDTRARPAFVEALTARGTRVVVGGN
jgi:DeoR/GlpR family transcriptional regulator of sugar metabolism